MRTAEEMELEKAGEAVVAALVGRRFGPIEVVGGSSEVRPNSEGDVSVFVDLRLSGPTQPKGPPWPMDAVRRLQVAFRAESNQLNPYGQTYLGLRPGVEGRSDQGRLAAG